MFLIVFTLGFLNFFWGEKVPAGGGFGWDGVNYANMVRNLDSMINGGQLSSYYTQRILPSGIVRAMMLLFGTAMSDSNIIKSFEIYNLVLLMIACWAWKRVADNFSLSLAGRWIGFGGIFINFECSKQAFYYPVLTDVTALTIAMFLLLFYIEKKPIHLFIVTVIGAFCWPVVSVCGAFLLMFLRSDLPKEVVTPVPRSFSISFSLAYLVTIACFAVLVLSIAGYLVLIQIIPVSEHACGVFNSQLRMLAQIMPRSINPTFERLLDAYPCVLEKLLIRGKGFVTSLPSLFGLLVALVMLIGSASLLKSAPSILRRTNLSLIVLAIAAVLVPALLVKGIANPILGLANTGNLTVLILAIFFHPDGKFLLPIVTLAVFWGPLVLLLILYWNTFCIQARKLGPGAMFVIAISLTLGLANEPRFLTIGWPFLVLGLVLTLESRSKSVSFKFALIFLTALYGQFWMKLNLAPWLSPDDVDILSYPKQIFFMHYGLWMNWWSYGVQFASLLLGVLWLRKTTKARTTKSMPL